MRTGRTGIAVRNAAFAVQSRAGPPLFLRGFENFADRRPPRSPYAARKTRQATGGPAGNR
ncbi:hypothetical protein [Streptomyces sp. NPDC059010]|uniref:hypothetical protein n=1 Tax=Streptomyces sp. NPDC059010 TaxID=3346695 RepID=UPI0036C8F86C